MKLNKYVLRSGMIFLLDDGLIKSKKWFDDIRRSIARCITRLGGEFYEKKIRLYFNSSV